MVIEMEKIFSSIPNLQLLRSQIEIVLAAFGKLIR